MVKLIARSVGHLIGIAILIFFAIATFKLWGLTTSYLEAAGGLVDVSLLRAMFENPLSGILYIYKIFSAAGGLDRLLHYGISWVCFVGTIGAGWMSILGVRGVYWGLVNELK